MPAQNAHIFFSYAHKDANMLIDIHDQMQNTLEHNLWMDRVGIERGDAWENSIKQAIDDSYGVIFAVTRNFLDSRFIASKEIPWVMERFDNKQGVQIFSIIFDDLHINDLPESLKTPFISHTIKAFRRPLAEVLAELKPLLPEPKAGSQMFLVNWPRLANFKGRDQQLIELHRKMIGDGRVGVKTASLYGTGGIGKTQLAVEYAHRYRYHYPGGVYWLNAGADWRKEVADCAVNIDRNLIEKTDEEKALAFRDYLTAQGKDALLVLDNVDDPNAVTQKEIAPRLTIAKICADTRTRLLLTTRVQKLPEGFEAVLVDVLKPEDALAVLLEAWSEGGRKDNVDVASLEAIAKVVGYLPLALGWIAAALHQLTDITPRELLEELRARGLDVLIGDLQAGEVKLGTPEYHDRLVGSVLDWQIGQLNNANARHLLALSAAFGEAVVVPLERLRLMMGLPNIGIPRPFPKAVKDLQSYSLVETLNGGMALRLHPLTQQYVIKKLEIDKRLDEAVPHLVAAYRDPATLDVQTRTRGFVAVMEDLKAAQTLLTTVNINLSTLTRLLTLEEPHLLGSIKGVPAEYVIQQIRERAYYENDNELMRLCET